MSLFPKRRDPNAQIHPLVAAVRARGTNGLYPDDVRDAAHEAFHALYSGVTGKWERERVHRALTKKIRRDLQLWSHEMHARAVEQIVCAHFGVDPGGDIGTWVLVSCMEAIKTRVPYASPEVSVPIAERFGKTPEARAWADRIIGLVQS